MLSPVACAVAKIFIFEHMYVVLALLRSCMEKGIKNFSEFICDKSCCAVAKIFKKIFQEDYYF